MATRMVAAFFTLSMITLMGAAASLFWGGGTTTLAVDPTATPTCAHPHPGWDKLVGGSENTPTPTPTPWCTRPGEPFTDPYEDNICCGVLPPGGLLGAFGFPMWRADVNNSGDLNSGDQLLVGNAIARCQFASPCLPTWTPTPTPTHTFTPTPTNTPTITPTATPTAYTVAMLVADTTGDHDGALCDYGQGDWLTNGRTGMPTPPASAVKITFWGTAQWTSCGQSTANSNVELRNLYAMVWDGADWVDYIETENSTFGPWCYYFNPLTVGTNFGQCSPGPSDFDMQPGERAAHWSSAQADLVSGAVCTVVTYEARLASGAGVMVNAGSDWIRSDTTVISDSFLSRYKALSGTWQVIAGTSCSESFLNSHVPPGF